MGILSERLRIAVLMGGPSREREVSLRSGEGVARALTEAGHVVTRYRVDGEELPGLVQGSVDVAFLALHGRFGEDGTCQRMLAARGIPYTGSGPEASALAFDKAAAKRALLFAGVPTPPWILFRAPLPPCERVAELVATLGYPCVLKPSCEGSSIGVFILDGPDDLPAAVRGLAELGGDAIVEPFIPGRELTVAILGDRALPPVEVIAARKLYDFTAKYDKSSGTRYVVDPTDLGDAVRARVIDTALAAHKALGCEGIDRIDIRLTPAGMPYVLEANTLPGMTETSLAPKAAAKAGLSYLDLCESLVAHALARHEAARAAAAKRSECRWPGVTPDSGVVSALEVVDGEAEEGAVRSPLRRSAPGGDRAKPILASDPAVHAPRPPRRIES